MATRRPGPARWLAGLLSAGLLLGGIAALGPACAPALPPTVAEAAASADPAPPPGAPWTELRRDTVRAGDTLERLLARFELPRELLSGLVRSYDGLHDHRWIRPGEPVALLADSGGALAFAHWPDPVRRLLLPLPLARQGDSLAACPPAAPPSVEELEPRCERRVVAGEIATSLYEAVLAAGGSPQLVLAFSDIVQWDVDFLIDPRRGDRFWLLVEDDIYAGDWLSEPLRREGRILAAAWQGARAEVRASWFEGCGSQGWFDSEGRSFQKQFLKSPLNYRRISSAYGNRRHPVTKMISLHAGVDFAAPAGTPVVAAADGVVEQAGFYPFYGNKITLKHGARYKTIYGHLKGFARGIRPGAAVRQNELIGYVGSTGRSTGPHLHYEFIDRGRSIDPLRIRNQPTEALPESCLPAHRRLYGMRFGELPRLGPSRLD
jgi:hypothetical protein